MQLIAASCFEPYLFVDSLFSISVEAQGREPDSNDFGYHAIVGTHANACYRTLCIRRTVTSHDAANHIDRADHISLFDEASPGQVRMAASQEPGPTKPWVYDLFLWVFTAIVDLFFREIHPRSTWKVPKSGPVIFVAAPHANQFVDPIILMRLLRHEANRRVSFLVAEKSLKRPFIGWGSRMAGAIGVGRALDLTKPAEGKIYLPDPENDPCLVRGIGTNFEAKGFQIGGLVVLPSINNESANAEILEILGPQELRLKKPFKGNVPYEQLTGKKPHQSNGDLQNGEEADGDIHKQIHRARDENGTSFKNAPKVDQSKVYDKVFKALSLGGCVGIFPEGGSHDRTELLPLKGESISGIVNATMAHLTLFSWCSHHGARHHGGGSCMRFEDRPRRYELL